MAHAFSGVLGIRFPALALAVSLSLACSLDERSAAEVPDDVAGDDGGRTGSGRDNEVPEGNAGLDTWEQEPNAAGAANEQPSDRGTSGSAGTNGAEDPQNDGAAASGSGGSKAGPAEGEDETSGGEGSDAGAPSEPTSRAGAPGAGTGGAASAAGGSGATGDAGEAPVGSGGTESGADAGGADTGGRGGSDAMGGSASGGSSSEPPPPIGQACLSCADDSAACDASVARCEQSPVCSAWLDCVTACSDAACARSCDETHRNAVLLTTPVYQCLCGECASECTSLAVCEQSCTEEESAPPASATTPATLAETGLYTQSGGNWQLAPYVRRFQPEFVLFSDYAEKERFIYLPRCTPIDTRDMDHWSFPVGTRVWKQFTQEGVRIETRVLVRYGTGAADWMMASYQWPSSGSTDPSLAVLAHKDGVRNVNGTGADIPAVSDCKFCHEKMTDRVLGFGAIQLSHELGDGLNFVDLVDWGALSHAPVRRGYDPPGDATAQAALGYMHANCGGCHNDTGIRVSLYLRLLVSQTSVESSWAYATGVNAPTTNTAFAMDRIEPGDPAKSSIFLRLARDPGAGETGVMPPVGRELVDAEGVAAVSAWIESLPR